jgi:hypothetical protein
MRATMKKAALKATPKVTKKEKKALKVALRPRIAKKFSLLMEDRVRNSARKTLGYSYPNYREDENDKPESNYMYILLGDMHVEISKPHYINYETGGATCHKEPMYKNTTHVEYTDTTLRKKKVPNSPHLIYHPHLPLKPLSRNEYRFHFDEVSDEYTNLCTPDHWARVLLTQTNDILKCFGKDLDSYIRKNGISNKTEVKNQAIYLLDILVYRNPKLKNLSWAIRRIQNHPETLIGKLATNCYIPLNDPLYEKVLIRISLEEFYEIVREYEESLLRITNYVWEFLSKGIWDSSNTSTRYKAPSYTEYKKKFSQ